MRRSPFAVALGLSVVVALTAGVAAFAATTKTVRLDVDGRVRSVHTFANHVAGVLRRAGIVLGPHDAVTPGPQAAVHDGSTVVVRHGRPLRLDLDRQVATVWVTALTVQGALDELGATDPGAWVSAPRPQPIPRQGMALAVRLPQRVVVLVDGHRLVRSTVDSTVGQLLADLNVRLHRLDRVSTPLTAYPRDGLVVTVDRINQRLVRRSIAIPFRVHRVRTHALWIGETKVTRHGRPGVRVATYRLRWRNRRLVHTSLVRSTVRRRPVAEILEVGVTPRPRYAPAHDGLNWPALAQCESGGNPRAVSANGEYRGLYQFTYSTWQSLGGSGDPIDAGTDEQTYRAQLLYHRSGTSAWPACGRYLYT